MTNYTGQEVDEMQRRRDTYAFKGVTISLCIISLSLAVVGFIFGWLAKGWMS